MKVVRRVRELHETGKTKYDLLAQELRDQLKPKVESENWFFLSRVKELESFALKLETGRVKNFEELEDFYACTIVVPTLAQIEVAESVIRDTYDVVERRPKVDSETHKSAHSFAFDDLRIFARRRPSASGKNEDLEGLLFEVQIRTILQHAWSIATHDLVYKTETVSWPKERIAYQVKAMLEHAEIAIAEAETLAATPGVAKVDRRTREVADIVELLKNTWDRDLLPFDVRRLAQTVHQLLQNCDVNVAKLSEILRAECDRLGSLPLNLSPYAFVIQALANSPSIDFKEKLAKTTFRMRVLIHGEMELPSWMMQEHDRILRLS